MPAEGPAPHTGSVTAPAYPGPAQRLAYAFGARLPSHRAWVVHDLTSFGWRLRALRRLALQVVPPSLLLALLPGPGYLHVMMPAFVILSALFVGAAYGDDLRDRRLRQHGVQPPRPAGPYGKHDLAGPPGGRPSR
jgi:hypothetical protein